MMGNTQWSGFLSYKAQHADIDSVLKSNWVPVKSFSVQGGTVRRVDLSTTSDVGVALEIEQSRSYKNLSLFLPRTRGFEWHHLWEIADHGLPVAISFFTSGSIGNTPVHQFNLSCRTAKITSQPMKLSDWDKNDVLKVSFSLPDIKIVHGSKQGGQFVEEEI